MEIKEKIAEFITYTKKLKGDEKGESNTTIF